MKLSDYVVGYFADRGIDHFFGYQGTMIAHFVDSIHFNKKVQNHICYNEQGAAFAAVGYAKASGRCALAYATSGPGAANLISGIADAYYDSTPVIFITGQLNTYEYTGIDGIRQNGFQEMDVINTVKGITKYCTKVCSPEDIREAVEKAYYMAIEGRPGPCLIDLPMNIQRESIDPKRLKGFSYEKPEVDVQDASEAAEKILRSLEESNAPVFIIGNGIKKESLQHEKLLEFARKRRIPVVTSMHGRQLMTYSDEINMGHIGGGYGHRYANIIVYKKADLVVSFGCSLCTRQTAMKPELFAKDASIIRMDLDPHELMRKIHQNENSYLCNCNNAIDYIHEQEGKSISGWLNKCNIIKNKLADFDSSCPERYPNHFIEAISDFVPEDSAICSDVGQHQVWTSQSFKIKGRQRLLFSGGHGAMGFSLPAAIGAHYALGSRSFVIAGDGSFQMNIQELQWVFREKIPVTIIVMNNHALGLIKQQQNDIFENRHTGSSVEGGYTTPDFVAIAEAYGIKAFRVYTPEEIRNILKEKHEGPLFIEVSLDDDSSAVPKTYFGEEMYNQKPYIPVELMEEILKI